MPGTQEILTEDSMPLRVVQQDPADKPAQWVEMLAVGTVKSVVVLADGQQNIDVALKPRLI